MPVPATVKSIDAVPEPIRQLYRKDGDRFVLDVQPADGFNLAPEDEYKAKIQHLQSKLTRATEIAAPWHDDEGKPLDAAKIKAMLAEQQKREQQKKEEPNQIEAIQNQLREKFEAERKALAAQLEQTTAELHRVLVDEAAIQAMAKHGANVDLLKPHLRDYVKAQKVDGRLVPVVFGADGKTPLITKKSGSTEPMGLEEFVGTVLREKFPQAFAPTAKRGSGTESAAGGDYSTPGKVTLSREDARDPVKYAAAKKANGGAPPTIVTA